MRKLSLATALCALLTAEAVAQTTSDQNPAEEEEARQETVVVTGRAQRLYRVEETDTGKLPTDPLSSSISITSINEQLIRDQGARDAQDLYRNISGVSV
ncbi:MAG: TonB-dependent siderophore receptor, partial [Pseudomonadota bacterium]